MNAKTQTEYRLVNLSHVEGVLNRWTETAKKYGFDGDADNYQKLLAEISAAPALPSVQEGEAIEVEPRYFSDNEGDSWFDCPDDIEFLGNIDPLEVGTEYELDVAYKNATRRYKVTKVPDETSDDYEVELVSHKGPRYFTYPPSAAAKIAEQDAEIARLQKELEEARKDRKQRIDWIELSINEATESIQADVLRIVAEFQSRFKRNVATKLDAANKKAMLSAAPDAAIRQIGGGE